MYCPTQPSKDSDSVSESSEHVATTAWFYLDTSQAAVAAEARKRKKKTKNGDKKKDKKEKGTAGEPPSSSLAGLTPHQQKELATNHFLGQPGNGKKRKD